MERDRDIDRGWAQGGLPASRTLVWAPGPLSWAVPSRGQERSRPLAPGWGRVADETGAVSSIQAHFRNGGEG